MEYNVPSVSGLIALGPIHDCLYREQRITMIPISKLAASIQPSATLAAGAKARQLKAEGIQVFDFSLGEPDFNTPEHICRAAFKAMQDGHTRYTPATGIAELRAAVARLYQKTYGLQ